MAPIHPKTYAITADAVRRLSQITDDACGFTVGTVRDDGYTVFTIHDPYGDCFEDGFEELGDCINYLTENSTVAEAIEEQWPDLWKVARHVDSIERQIADSRIRNNLTDAVADAYALALL